jgi:hypothetical protein
MLYTKPAGFRRIKSITFTGEAAGVLEVWIDIQLNMLLFRFVFDREEELTNIFVFYEVAGQKKTCHCNEPEIGNPVRWNKAVFDPDIIDLNESQIVITKIESQVIVRLEQEAPHDAQSKY